MFALPRENDPENAHSDREEAFIGLVTRAQKPIFGFLMALVPRAEDAEDILQRTNVAMWRKRMEYEPGTNFKAWAFAFARWESRAFMSETKRKGWLVYNDDLAALVAERMSAIPDTRTDSMPDSLLHCLGKLSAKHRQLVLERYSSELSLKECAQLFDRSESGLRVTLHRLRITLRRCVSKYMDTSNLS